jgi:hypothetical protein
MMVRIMGVRRKLVLVCDSFKTLTLVPVDYDILTRISSVESREQRVERFWHETVKFLIV